ncbi:hypothetical protein SDC9_87477 [bioreactor metagenome]|uniref:mannan endo-1,4-beta-mannosidase n=1 Tax=bioreactor metagenome TaxID=1076179 RepID=A0A644ZJ13_9ZZZZ
MELINVCMKTIFRLFISLIFFSVGCTNGINKLDKCDEITNCIKVSENYPRYFEKDNQTWIPISINYLPENNLQRVEEYFKKFSENGGNSMRIWISTPFLEIEDSVEGVYNEEKFQRIDKILELAEKYDIYIKFTLHHIRTISETSQPGSEWANSKVLSTKFKDIKEYINTPEGRGSYIRRAKALSERYKDNKHIYGWELWNEMDAAGNEKEVMDFTTFMLDTIKALFPNKLVVQTLGSLHSKLAENTYRELTEIPGNDFLSIHRYLDEGEEWGQYDVVKSPIDILASDAVHFGNELTKNRPVPVIMNEIGAVEPNHIGPFRFYKEDKEGILIHDMIFAPFFSGSAGSGSMWHWNHYIFPQDLWPHFQKFKNAIVGIDPVKEKFIPSFFEKENVRCYVLNGKNKTMIWCRDGANSWRTEFEDGVPAVLKENFTILANDLKTNKFKKVRIYDPWKDSWNTNINVRDNEINIPSFLRSIVIILEL